MLMYDEDDFSFLIIPYRPTAKHEDMGGERPSKVGEHYEVIRKIGEGSFGIIYLGRSDMTDDLVAIKFVHN